MKKEDAVILKNVKIRIGEAVENKAADKMIGARVTSQPIVSALESDSNSQYASAGRL